jgi:hypothetical protein
MNLELKPGTRLRSVACSTEVIVVRAPSESVELRCGGHPLLRADDPHSDPRQLEPGLDRGTMLGKRYTDETHSLEVLCMKSGKGSLSIGEVPLQLSGAKPLPASD